MMMFIVASHEVKVWLDIGGSMIPGSYSGSSYWLDRRGRIVWIGKS